jgi:hypothetical protein
MAEAKYNPVRTAVRRSARASCTADWPRNKPAPGRLRARTRPASAISPSGPAFDLRQAVRGVCLASILAATLWFDWYIAKGIGALTF